MIIIAIIVFLVLLGVGGFATCDLVFDDESEAGVGRVVLVKPDHTG